MSSGPSDDDRSARRRPRSLAASISAWYVAALIASLAVLAAVAVPALRAAIGDRAELVVESKVERHFALLMQRGLPAYESAVESSATLGERELAVRVRDADGRTLYERGDVTASMRTSARESRELRLEIGELDDPWAALGKHLRPELLALAAIAIVLALAGGFYVTRRALLPIRQLAAATRDVAVSGDLSRRVPERGGTDELATLTHQFNRMLERNQQLVRGMRDALDNVAHDLRTPLTRIRGAAELALRSEDPAGPREALADTIEESDRVLAMLRALMDISEAETGIMRLDLASVSLSDVARDAVELYAHVADHAGVDLTLGDAEPVTAHVDRGRLRQALANLIDNAIKYTPPGGSIVVDVSSDASHARISVRDTGEGIPADALPRIWERLYRADPSRSRPGLGLGLALVRAIVGAHGGDVTVESEPGRGSTFTVRLPLE